MQDLAATLVPLSTEAMDRLAGTLLFDADHYRAAYPDVALTGLDPLYHFQRYGAFLQRDPNARFDTRAYITRHGLPPGGSWLTHYLDTFGGDRRAAGAMPPSDLKRKLWGGFAAHAHGQMKDALRAPGYTAKERGQIAYFLARWHATQGEWDETAQYCKAVARFDRGFSRTLRAKLLYIEARIRIGELDDAEEMIKFSLSKGLDGNYVCARMNAMLLGGLGSDADRLAMLNTVMRANGLVEIGLQDPAAPLALHNLACAVDEDRWCHGPTVSILVPCYNAEEHLDIAIGSLLNQTWRDIEIVAIDDCSTDGTWQKLQALAAGDPRLKVVRNERNMGAYPTRNRALALSSGQFVCVHDSDDWSHPQMLELQLRPLLEDPAIRGTCSAMVRAQMDLQIILRPQRDNLEYVHRSYPSLLMRREDVVGLGEWDSVAANADDEFVQRCRLTWGAESLVDVLPGVPLSIFLVHESSLTQQQGTSLNSLTFGIRSEYARQARHWRESRASTGKASLTVARTGWKDPFPIPMGLAPKHWVRDTRYDLVIVSDLSLLGGTRRCNEAYIHAAIASGLRVGLFHWPRFDLKIAEIDDLYTELSYHPRVDFLVREDVVSCGALLIHHPPILGFEIDGVPAIDADFVGILVNQLPMQRWTQSPFYYDARRAEAMCQRMFGRDPVWIAISERVERCLRQIGGFSAIHPEIWYPPLREVPDDTALSMPDFDRDGPIVVGRHARDHWTKWPALGADIAAAYCAGAEGIDVRILGSAGNAVKAMGGQPANWTIADFDTVGIDDFVRGLDFLLHYVHEDYIEEFGRSVSEAMAMGRVVIVPPSFRDVFGDAAVYAQPDAVADVVRELWSQPDRYLARVAAGRAFVQRHCGPDVTARKLQSLITR